MSPKSAPSITESARTRTRVDTSPNPRLTPCPARGCTLSKEGVLCQELLWRYVFLGFDSGLLILVSGSESKSSEITSEDSSLL